MEFQFRSPILEAINTGNVDFGYTGDAPPIFAKAARANLLYVAALPSAGANEAIIVPENSSIGTIADLKDRAPVVMWERRMELEGFAAVMETVRNAAAGLKGRAIAGTHDHEQIPALVERGRLRVTDFYGDLEARLAEVPFVAGNQFSAADITAIVAIDFAGKALNLSIPESHQASKRWYAAVAAWPSMST